VENQDIRWKQRLANYSRALLQLEKAVDMARQKILSELEKQGVIQVFEFTHELAWHVMKDYFEYQGETNLHGSRNASRLAFQRGILENGHLWMEMIKSRNKTSHTYNEETANEIFEKTIDLYFDAFKAFETKMKTIRNEEDNSS